jgi:hypothetical protein
MKWLLVFLFALTSCAHKDMNIKKAMKLCRKLNGPQQPLPKPMPRELEKAQQEIVGLIGSCYREHVERTRDPRDYVTCAVATFEPKNRPRVAIQSPKDLILPEIVLQCVNQGMTKLKAKPVVKKTQKLEFVFHHIAVTKG